KKSKVNSITYGSGEILIPDFDVLRDMSWSELAELYHRYLGRNQVECKEVTRLGRVTDGGWDMCSDSPYKPASPCIVYSFGIADDFSFDNAVVDQLGCTVYSFDPSINMDTKQRGDKKYFYKMGLADSDRTLSNGWSMSRLETIRASLKHTKKVLDILKMDVEEWEWEVLPDLLTSDQLKTTGQLLIELHQCDGCSKYNPEQPDKEPSKERYIHMLQLLRQLYEQNFRIFHHHDNKACRYLSKFTLMEMTACKEIGFIRVSQT
ncbi:methyltransferase protein 24, partial [Biomphalaria glabrata]